MLLKYHQKLEISHKYLQNNHAKLTKDYAALRKDMALKTKQINKLVKNLGQHLRHTVNIPASGLNPMPCKVVYCMANECIDSYSIQLQTHNPQGLIPGVAYCGTTEAPQKVMLTLVDRLKTLESLLQSVQIQASELQKKLGNMHQCCGASEEYSGSCLVLHKKTIF